MLNRNEKVVDSSLDFFTHTRTHAFARTFTRTRIRLLSSQHKPVREMDRERGWGDAGREGKRERERERRGGNILWNLRLVIF